MTPEQQESLEAGTEVFSCNYDLSGRRLEVRRYYVQSNNGYLQLGDSMHRDAFSTTCRAGEAHWRSLTPEAAVEAFVQSAVKGIEGGIAKKEREIEELRQKAVYLRSAVPQDVPVRGHPRDWVPCDY